MNTVDLFGEVVADGFRGVARRAVRTGSAGWTLAEGEAPRDRLERFGVAALSDVELLALVLEGAGVSAETAVEYGRALLVEFGGLLGVGAAGNAELVRRGGLTAALAGRVVATLEIGRRCAAVQATAEPLLNRASLIAAHVAPLALGLQVEKCWVLCLDRKHRLVRCCELSSGTLTSALMHPREVYRTALVHGSASIAIAHNHPSGDPAPSAPDLQVTRLMRDAGRAVDVELLDHVVVGRAAADPTGKGFFSFREAGLL